MYKKLCSQTPHHYPTTAILTLKRETARESATATYHPEGDSTTVYDENGRLIEEQRAHGHSKIVWGIIGDAFKYSNQKSVTISQKRSLMDYFHASVVEKGLDKESTKLVLQMARIWGDFIGDPVEKQSLKYLWLEECIDGGPSQP